MIHFFFRIITAIFIGLEILWEMAGRVHNFFFFQFVLHFRVVEKHRKIFRGYQVFPHCFEGYLTVEETVSCCIHTTFCTTSGKFNVFSTGCFLLRFCNSMCTLNCSIKYLKGIEKFGSNIKIIIVFNIR